MPPDSAVARLSPARLIPLGLAALLIAGLAAASACGANPVSCGRSTALRADLTGNGISERLQLRIVGSGNSCYGLLRATVGGMAVTERITLSKGAAPDTLALVGAHNVNGVPGADLIVRVWRGASTDFFRVYTLRRGAFAAMSVPRTSVPSVDAFPFGGALGSDETVTCIGPALIIDSKASLVDKHWTVHRSWYRASATGFVPSRSVTVQVSRLASLKEFRVTTPFATCP